MSRSTRLSGVRLAGFAGVLFGVALFGFGGLAGATGVPSAVTSAVGTPHVAPPAATAPCAITGLTISINPTPVRAGVPMSVQIAPTLSANSPASCVSNEHVTVHGLPAGCGVQTVMQFVCTPTMPGSYQVRTAVSAQNTALTVVDTVTVF